MKFHKEGRGIIPVSFLIIAAVVAGLYILTWGSLLLWLSHVLCLGGIVLFGLIVNFFRNPPIHIPKNPNHILSPCDGKVVVIEEVFDDVFFQEKVKMVSIFMSPLNVHVNRNPIGGKIVFLKYYKGKYLVAFNPKSSELNERTFLAVQNEKLTVAYKQIAGYVARRIKWYVKEGDEVGQGEEFGFIRFGSRMDVLMPLSCEIVVNLEQDVKGGQSILAKLQD